MCKYCDFEFDENMECWEATREIHSVKRPFGYTDIEQRTSIFVLAGDKNHLRSFNINCEVSVGENVEDMVFDTYIPIQYCPFCGRKLTFPDEEAEEYGQT